MALNNIQITRRNYKWEEKINLLLCSRSTIPSSIAEILPMTAAIGGGGGPVPPESGKFKGT